MTAKAKRELEEMYLGVLDDSVNLTFKDLARPAIQKQQQPSYLNVESLGFDDTTLKIDDKPISALTRLPSLDFKRALEASSRYPTHDHNHSYSSNSPQQNHRTQKKLNLSIENPAKPANIHSYHGHLVADLDSLYEDPMLHGTASNHHDHHGGQVRYAHQTIDGHHKRILQRGHGGEAQGNHVTDMHVSRHQHHAIPCHDSTACHVAYDNYDAMSRTSEMTTDSMSAATATPPYQGRRRPGTPHSNICTVCTTYVYIFRHRCLVRKKSLQIISISTLHCLLL